MDFANIPMELKERPQWLLWKYEMREKRRTKIPYSARNGKPARWQDPESWAPFGEAVWMLKDKQFDGIGFVLTSADPWTGVDIDHCLNQETGEIDEEAMSIVRELSTYTEITPSGTGLHLFCRAKLPEGRRRAGRLEMYDSDRFLTMTGELLPGGPVAIQDRQEEINALHAATFPEAEGRQPDRPTGRVSVPADDAAVIEKIVRDSHYESLWRGDHSDYSSQSEADLALAGRIGFFVGWDAGAVDRLFRQSGLYRPKWDEARGTQTYGTATALKACSGVRPAYHWYPNGVNGSLNSSNSLISLRDRASSPGTASLNSLNSLNSYEDEGRPWPARLAPEAYYGFAGDVVQTLAPHTEADEAALLVNFLVCFGTVIGRRPRIQVGTTRHGLNLFASLVGRSGSGKGMSWDPVKELFARAVPEFIEQHILHGLSSGEGLIATVRDRSEKRVQVKDKKTGRMTMEFETVVEDEGVDDKRQLIVETEMANLLKVMARPGNTISPRLREAWDSGDLQVVTRTSPLTARGAHIGMLAHITPEELMRLLTETEAANGFGNRFLWILTRRAQLLPEGGGEPSLNTLVSNIYILIEQASVIDLIARDEAAKQVWAAVYGGLKAELPGMFGSVIGRAAPQVARLSAIYAALDGLRSVSVAHLMAALAVWQYAEDSALWIFGNATGDPLADTLFDTLAQRPEGTSRTDLHAAVGRNQTAASMGRALGELLRAGKVRVEHPKGEGGRTVECWYAVTNLTNLTNLGGRHLSAARQAAQQLRAAQ